MALGNLNGWWEKLFKAFLSVFSVLLIPHISWVVWVTSSIFMMNGFMTSGERFTQQDGRDLETRIQRSESDLEHIQGDLDDMKEDLKEILKAVRP